MAVARRCRYLRIPRNCAWMLVASMLRCEGKFTTYAERRMTGQDVWPKKKAPLPKAFTVAVGPRCAGRTEPRTVAAATYYVTCGKDRLPSVRPVFPGPA